MRVFKPMSLLYYRIFHGSSTFIKLLFEIRLSKRKVHQVQGRNFAHTNEVADDKIPYQSLYAARFPLTAAYVSKFSKYSPFIKKGSAIGS